MVDEIFDRTYQSGRAEFNAGLDRLGESIGKSFKALHRIQWSAPWKRKSTNVQCG